MEESRGLNRVVKVGDGKKSRPFEICLLAFCIDNRYLSSEDALFVDLVVADLEDFQEESLDKVVLLFPPVNNYLRLLIHKTVEDFADLHSFSVGEGDGRQTVVCLTRSLIEREKSNSLVADYLRPQIMRGRGRARFKDRNSSSPGHREDAEDSADRWNHDRYSSNPCTITPTPVCAQSEGTNRQRAGLPCQQDHYRSSGVNRQERDIEQRRNSPASGDSALPSTARKPERSKNRRPDVQVYVPRARRSQPGHAEAQTSVDQTSPARTDAHATPRTAPVRLKKKEMEPYIPRGRLAQRNKAEDSTNVTLQSDMPLDTFNERTETVRIVHKKIKVADTEPEDDHLVDFANVPYVSVSQPDTYQTKVKHDQKCVTNISDNDNRLQWTHSLSASYDQQSHQQDSQNKYDSMLVQRNTSEHEYVALDTSNFQDIMDNTDGNVESEAQHVTSTQSEDIADASFDNVTRDRTHINNEIADLACECVDQITAYNVESDVKYVMQIEDVVNPAVDNGPGEITYIKNDLADLKCVNIDQITVDNVESKAQHVMQMDDIVDFIDSCPGDAADNKDGTSDITESLDSSNTVPNITSCSTVINVLSESQENDDSFQYSEEIIKHDSEGDNAVKQAMVDSDSAQSGVEITEQSKEIVDSNNASGFVKDNQCCGFAAVDNISHDMCSESEAANCDIGNNIESGNTHTNAIPDFIFESDSVECVNKLTGKESASLHVHNNLIDHISNPTETLDENSLKSSKTMGVALTVSEKSQGISEDSIDDTGKFSDKANKFVDNFEVFVESETRRCDSDNNSDETVDKASEVGTKKCSKDTDSEDGETVESENKQTDTANMNHDIDTMKNICASNCDEAMETTESNIDDHNLQELLQTDQSLSICMAASQSQNITSHQSENITIDSDQSEEEEVDVDSWDAMFDDDGESLDPTAMEELTNTVGKVKIQKSKKINYLKYQPKDKSNFDFSEYEHIIEIYNFPTDFVTRDLIMAFQSFMSRGFDLKWVDDTHALGIFSSAIAAKDALSMAHPLLKLCPLSEASKQSQNKARQCTEFLQPYKPRPEMSATVARRLVAGALGVATGVSREKRALERLQLKEAKAKKREERKNREDIWEYGKCAMDEET